MKYTVHIDAPPELVFEIALDPELQSDSGLKTEAVNETPSGVGSEFRYHYEVLGLRVGKGGYTFVEYVPGRRVKMDFTGGGVPMLLIGGPVSSTWTFEPADGGTDVTVHPVFKTRIPVVNHLARRMMMRSWRRQDIPKLKAEIEKRARAVVKA